MFFYVLVLRDKEQGIRLKARKINGLEDSIEKKME